jgi:hypothetical protein
VDEEDRTLKRIPWLLIGLACCWAPAVTAAPDPVARVLDRFCEASGGRERLAKLASVSVTARIDAMDSQYALHMLADGRFRNEGRERTTVFDGQKYWQVYYGLVQEVTGEYLARVREVSLNEVFLHGLFDAAGRPAKLEYTGSETRRGKTHELLAATLPDGRKRTFYFDGTTGLLSKIVELVPDPDLRELKKIYTVAEYQDCGGLQLPTAFQILCVTTGDEIQPLTRFTDIRVNQPVDERLYARPESTVPPAELAEGWLIGQVVGVSGRGSLITSFTQPDLARLNAADQAVLIAEVRGRQTRHMFTADMQGVSSGEYVATFNNSPLLWLVKAYVGMTSDQSYAVGDQVRLTAAGSPQEEVGR